jgi:hypothetical protein
MQPTVQFGGRTPREAPADPRAAKASDLPPWLGKSILWFIGIVSCLMSISMVVGAQRTADQRVYLNNHGVTTQGIVVDKSVLRGGYHSYAPDQYHIVYQITLQDGDSGPVEVFTHDEVVTFSDYSKVRAGDQIPVRYDPQNPFDNEQYMDGKANALRVFLFVFGERGLFFTAIGLFTLIYAAWKFVGGQGALRPSRDELSLD